MGEQDSAALRREKTRVKRFNMLAPKKTLGITSNVIQNIPLFWIYTDSIGKEVDA